MSEWVNEWVSVCCVRRLGGDSNNWLHLIKRPYLLLDLLVVRALHSSEKYNTFIPIVLVWTPGLSLSPTMFSFESSSRLWFLWSTAPPIIVIIFRAFICRIISPLSCHSLSQSVSQSVSFCRRVEGSAVQCSAVQSSAVQSSAAQWGCLSKQEIERRVACWVSERASEWSNKINEQWNCLLQQ